MTISEFTREDLEFLIDVIDNNRITHRCGSPEDYKNIRDKAQKILDSYGLHDKCLNPECKLSRHASDVGCIK